MLKNAHQIAHEVLTKCALLEELTTPSGAPRGDLKDLKNIFVPDNEVDEPTYEEYYEDSYTGQDPDYDYRTNQGVLFSDDPIVNYKEKDASDCGSCSVDGAPAQKYTRGRGGWRNVPQHSDVDPKYQRDSQEKELVRTKLRGQ